MKLVPKHLILAGMLAYAGLSAQAQTPTDAPKGPPPAGHEHRGGPGGKFDPAKMQAFQAKRLADLKAKLKLTPAQEGAWTTFTTELQPPAQGPRPERGEMEKLTTPQRLDKMREMRTQRNAEMDRRAEATKAFYAQLDAGQQKTFDAQSLRMMHRPDHPMRHGKHPHGGKPGQEKPAAAPAQ